MKTIAVTPSSQSLPFGLSQAGWHEVVAVAARKWSHPSVPCTSVEVLVGSPRDWRTVADDDVNLVVFRDHVWCKNERCGRAGQFSSLAMGMTQTYPEGARGAGIRGADVQLNSVNFSFQVNIPPVEHTTSQSLADKPLVKLEGVVLHELGHVLGLGDKCVPASRGYQAATCSSDDMNSVMFAPAQHLELARSDVSALCALHPRNGNSNGRDVTDHSSPSSGHAVALGGFVIATVFGIVVICRRRYGS